MKAETAKRDAIARVLRDYPEDRSSYVATDVAEVALEALKADGWVILRAESVRRAQERQRLAEARAQWETADAEHARRWGEDAHREIRRLSDRITFLYGEARARGASHDDLKGPE